MCQDQNLNPRSSALANMIGCAKPLLNNFWHEHLKKFTKPQFQHTVFNLAIIVSKSNKMNLPSRFASNIMKGKKENCRGNSCFKTEHFTTTRFLPVLE